LAQLLWHGAQVVRVEGTYDQAFDLSLQVIQERKWYSRNCAHNPLLVEGKKTAGLEIAAALGWHPPDAVFVPVGDGCIISSVGKAFSELKKIGLCPQPPRLYGVQAAQAAPLAKAWQAAGSRDLSGSEILAAIQPLVPETCADSIAVGIPRNRIKAWQQVHRSGGAFLSVSDEEILAAARSLATQAGLFAEPAGAAGLAGLGRAQQEGWVGQRDRVVILVTGHGLKDPFPFLKQIDLPKPVPPQGPLPV
jgi:threonine synthase